MTSIDSSVKPAQNAPSSRTIDMLTPLGQLEALTAEVARALSSDDAPSTEWMRENTAALAALREEVLADPLLVVSKFGKQICVRDYLVLEQFGKANGIELESLIRLAKVENGEVVEIFLSGWTLRNQGEGLSGLSGLKKLVADECGLTISKYIGEIESLEELALNLNYFTDQLLGLVGHKSLITLWAQGCKLSSTVNIGMIPSLRVANLTGNDFKNELLVLEHNESLQELWVEDSGFAIDTPAIVTLLQRGVNVHI